MRRMRAAGLGRRLCRTVLAVAFGFMSLHGPVMAIALASPPDHQAGAAMTDLPGHEADASGHASHRHPMPQAPEKASICRALACCVAVAPLPTIAQILHLAAAQPLGALANETVAGANPAPPDPPPRLQA